MASYTPATAIENRARLYNPTPYNLYLWEEDLTELGTSMTPFLVLEFVGGQEVQKSVGAPNSNWWEEIGVFSIHLFYPSGLKSSVFREYMKDFAAVFRGKDFDSVHCRAPFPPVHSDRYRDKGNWRSITMAVPYWYRLLG